jgi:hypothetical protein
MWMINQRGDAGYIAWVINCLEGMCRVCMVYGLWSDVVDEWWWFAINWIKVKFVFLSALQENKHFVTVKIAVYDDWQVYICDGSQTVNDLCVPRELSDNSEIDNLKMKSLKRMIYGLKKMDWQRHWRVRVLAWVFPFQGVSSLFREKVSEFFYFIWVIELFYLNESEY